MPDPGVPAPDFYLLGYSDDVRALLDHLRAEAPHLVRRVVLVVPPGERGALGDPGDVAVVAAEPSDVMALLDAGIERATVIAVFLAGAAATTKGPALVRTLRRLCPDAEVFAAAGVDDTPLRRRLGGLAFDAS